MINTESFCTIVPEGNVYVYTVVAEAQRSYLYPVKSIGTDPKLVISTLSSFNVEVSKNGGQDGCPPPVPDPPNKLISVILKLFNKLDVAVNTAPEPIEPI